MTRKITCSFTLTDEIIEYIEAHAGIAGRSALVRQMLVDYIHSTEIRQYRHAESGQEVLAFRCMSHDVPELPFGFWAVYDGDVSSVIPGAEFKAQYEEVEEDDL